MYRGYVRNVAHWLKGEQVSVEYGAIVRKDVPDDVRRRAVSLAAKDMAALVPMDSVLVPIPSHVGYATDTLTLANEVARISGFEVLDVLRSDERESSYEAKKDGRDAEIRFRLTSPLPVGKTIVYVDNIIASGTTARAAMDCAKGVMLVYTVCKNSFKENLVKYGCIDRKNVFVGRDITIVKMV